jgi:hypothetical protein
MSLLTDLHSLDLAKIQNARASLHAAVSGSDLQSIVNGGAAQTALAGLGSSLSTLQNSFQRPEALLQPLVGAVGSLTGSLNLDGVPVGPYLSAVSDGATILIELIEGLQGDPAKLTAGINDLMEQGAHGLRSAGGGFVQVGLEELSRFRHFVEVVENGFPADAQAVTELAVDILIPFPRAHLNDIRTGLTGILDGAASIALPDTRTAGLVAALDAVAAAAATGDAIAVTRALQDLERARLNTIAVLHDELVAIVGKINDLRLDTVLRPLLEISGVFRDATQGILEFLEDWRQQIVRARQQVESFDPAQLAQLLPSFIQELETWARANLVLPLDEQIQQLQDWLRGLLAHLPLAELRQKLTDVIHAIAQAIQDAHLDQVANEIRNALKSIQSHVDPASLTADVKQALQAAEQAISHALDGVVAALGTIGTEISAVAGQAQAILQRAADALKSFRAAIDRITKDIENLGVDEAAQQVVDTLTQLRETAEKLLAAMPLPDSLRPVVQQLIDAVQSVDLDAVFKPMRDAAAQIHLPEEVGTTITDALAKVRDALTHLIPEELIRSIEAEVNSALDVIRNFNPGTLLSGVTQYLTEAADAIEKLDPRPAVASIRGPFQAVLDAVDRANPTVLLAPVISAYDSLMGSLPAPNPSDSMGRVLDVIGSAGDSLGRAAVSPISRLAPQGAVETPQTGSSAGAGSGTGTGSGTGAGASAGTPPTPPDDLRPGDIVRMFGYLPGKLREGLAAIQAGPAGDVRNALDALTTGLARDLRRLQAALWEIEARLQTGLDDLLIPLNAAQFRAQVALQRHMSAGGFQVDAAMNAVALAGPEPIRAALADALALAVGRTHQAAASAGGRVGTALEQIAQALERCRLSGVTHDLNALLAALDPEPIAAELDALVAAVLKKAPALFAAIGDQIQAAVQTFKALVRDLNPGAQVQKLLVVLDVLREQFDLLNPRRLAAELGEVHANLRAAIAAYDPAVFAAEIAATLTAIVAGLRALNPTTLLGDLSFLTGIVNKVEQALPTKALEGIGASLTEVGQQLSAIRPAELLDAINSLAPRVEDSFEKAITAVKEEILALLKSLQYASENAGASVSISASARAG